MKKIWVASVAIVASLFAAHAAEAKLACYPLKQIEKALGTEYGEKQQFAGREESAEAKTVEYRLYVNAETGSWSWVGIPAGGEIGCLIFAGKMPETRANPEPTATPRVPPLQF
jgi:hypothetical protein